MLKTKRFFILCIASLLFAYSVFSTVCTADDIKKDTKQTATVLMEVSTGQVILKENIDEKMCIGTLNKIMTVLLTAEAIDEGKLTLDTLVTASAHAKDVKGAVIWLEPGEKMSVRDLLKGVLIGNANDASVALSEAVSGTEERFITRMNERAKALGMDNTVFANPTGSDTEGQYSTAYDTALMCRALLKYRFLYEYMTVWRDFLRDGKTELVNTNTLVKTYKGITGLKASSTVASENCLALSAERDGTAYVSVVLGYKDKDQCFSAAKALLNSSFSNYIIVAPEVDPKYLTEVKVQGGTETSVNVKRKEDISLIIPVGSEYSITCEVFYPKWVNAPVKENQNIGVLAFYCGDKMIYETDIVAADNIDKMSVGYAFYSLLKSLLN